MPGSGAPGTCSTRCSVPVVATACPCGYRCPSSAAVAANAGCGAATRICGSATAHPSPPRRSTGCTAATWTRAMTTAWTGAGRRWRGSCSTLPPRPWRCATGTPGGQLLGVGICDLTGTSLSTVYFFFEPTAHRRSLGTFSSLTEIGVARKLGLQFYYQGYWVPGCQRMEYKSALRPAEGLCTDGRLAAPVRGGAGGRGGLSRGDPRGAQLHPGGAVPLGGAPRGAGWRPWPGTPTAPCAGTAASAWGLDPYLDNVLGEEEHWVSGWVGGTCDVIAVLSVPGAAAPEP